MMLKLFLFNLQLNEDGVIKIIIGQKNDIINTFIHSFNELELRHDYSYSILN